MNKKDYMYIMSYIQNKKYSCEEITFRTICDIQSMIRDVFTKTIPNQMKFPPHMKWNLCTRTIEKC